MRACALLAGLAAWLCTTAARPATLLEFDRWMREIDHASVHLQERLAQGDASAARVDAEALARLYGRMRDFFTAEGDSADAVQWSEDGRQHATAAADAVARQDLAFAAAAALRITRACNDCHDLYKPFNDLRKR